MKTPNRLLVSYYRRTVQSLFIQRTCIHKKVLMTEIYKTRNDLKRSFMQEIFRENMTHYNLRNNNEFIQLRVRSVNNGSESVRFKSPQLWQTLPPTVRNSESLCHLKQR